MPLSDIDRSRVATHAPTRGNRVEVYIARLADGQQTAPVDQELLTPGFRSVVTISGSPSASDAYVLVLTTSAVDTTLTYTYTSGTNETIVDGLVALVNASTAVARYRAFKLSATTFAVCAPATFTIADTGSTTAANITPGSVSGAAPPIKGATTVTLHSALTGQINAGQFLCYYDFGTGEERLVEVTANADVGATSLTVAPLKEALYAGMVAEYPPYLWDRTDASTDRSYTDATVTTFNTGGAVDGVPTTIEKTMSLPGIYYYYNAAYWTALKSAEDQAFIYVKRRRPAPGTGFIHGGITEGRALVTSAPDAAPADNFVNADLEIAFRGSTTETAALAT